MYVFPSLIIWSCIIVIRSGLQEFTEFYSDNTLDGYMCQGTKVVINFTSLDSTHCALQCSRTFTCVAIFFVPSSEQCVGCSSQFDPSVKELLEGSIFYKRRYNFSYLGCYYDALPHRILSGLWTVTSTMTTEECVNACMKGNYTHALTESMQFCICGNGFVLPVYKAPESDCYMACSGNPSQSCGANARGMVYLIK